MTRIILIAGLGIGCCLCCLVVFACINISARADSIADTFLFGEEDKVAKENTIPDEKAV